MTTRIRPTAPRTALVLGTALAAALMLGACSAGTDSGTPSTSSSGAVASQQADAEDERGDAPGGAPETALAGDQEMLADHGLDGLDVRELIQHLDTQAVADRPADLVASVQPDRLLVADDAGRQTELPMPQDAVYVSAAPYVSQTHDCHFHSLTTCRGELANQQVQVRLVDADTGDVLIDEARTTFDNGFVGMWVPRGISGELTIEHEGRTATSAVSTRGSEDATCLTELQLRRG